MYIYISFSNQWQEILAKVSVVNIGGVMVLPPKNNYELCDLCEEVSNCIIIYVLPKFFSSKISNIVLCKKCLFELGEQRCIYICEQSEVKSCRKRTLKQKIRAFIYKIATFFRKSIPEYEITKSNMSSQNIVDEIQDDEIQDDEITRGNNTNLEQKCTRKFKRTNALGSLRKFNEEEYDPKVKKSRRSGAYRSLKIFTDK